MTFCGYDDALLTVSMRSRWKGTRYVAIAILGCLAVHETTDYFHTLVCESKTGTRVETREYLAVVGRIGEMEYARHFRPRNDFGSISRVRPKVSTMSIAHAALPNLVGTRV